MTYNKTTHNIFKMESPKNIFFHLFVSRKLLVIDSTVSVFDKFCPCGNALLRVFPIYTIIHIPCVSLLDKAPEFSSRA